MLQKSCPKYYCDMTLFGTVFIHLHIQVHFPSLNSKPQDIYFFRFFYKLSENCDKRLLASSRHIRPSVCPHGTTWLPLDRI